MIKDRRSMGYVYATLSFKQVIRWKENKGNTEELEIVYFQVLKLFNSMTEDMYKTLENFGSLFLPYIEDLIHETRAHGGTFLGSIRNYDFYKRERPEKETQSLESTIYREFHRFYLGVQAMEVFYHTIYLKGEY